MIQGFEDYTHELTDVELKKVLPIIVKGLSNKIGKQNAVSNKFICETLNKKQMFEKYKLTSPRIRKIVNHIRHSTKHHFLVDHNYVSIYLAPIFFNQFKLLLLLSCKISSVNPKVANIS